MEYYRNMYQHNQHKIKFSTSYKQTIANINNRSTDHVTFLDIMVGCKKDSKVPQLAIPTPKGHELYVSGAHMWAETFRCCLPET